MNNSIGSKKIIITICAAFIIGIAIGCITDRFIVTRSINSHIPEYAVNSQSSKTESSLQTESVSKSDPQINSDIQFNYIDTSEFVNCLTDGVYRCGTDFNEGDYYILSLFGTNANYDISSSLDNFGYEERIIRKIHADKGQYIKLVNALLIPESDFNFNNYNKYGIFIIGKDIAAGEYKIEPISDEYKNAQYNSHWSGNLGAYQITKSDVLDDTIACQTLTEKQSYLTLHDGEVLMINNAALTLIQDY